MGNIDDVRDFVPAEEARVAPRLRALDDRLFGGGDIVLDPPTIRRAGIASLNGRDRRTREIDILRTHMLRTLEAEGLRTLAVVSPRAGCGASFVALNLAVALARLGERPIVLIDADLRAPELTARLRLESTSGLPQALGGFAATREILLPVRIGAHRLRVASGGSAVNPAELLASRGLREVLDDIEDELPGALVVVDTHPLLDFDDTLALLPRIDKALLVLRSGVTSARDVETASRLVPPERLAAAVLNRHR